MQTFQIINVAIPVGSYTFEDLREEISRQAKEPIAKTTLRDWIADVCKLRSEGIYTSEYDERDLECLVQWLAFRVIHKRGTAKRRFQEYLKTLAEDKKTNGTQSKSS